MHLSSVVLSSLLILNLQLCSTYPVTSHLTGTDMDVLKVLLNRLEESLPERTVTDRDVPAERDSLEELAVDAASEDQQAQVLDDAKIREIFSAKNLKSVRNDSSRKSSSCFGHRVDRITSTSSMGCKSIGIYNPKSDRRP
ncbi:natriuretic peptides B [Salarias fasciatus]|uniref:natriuretic peptides B n=1 Tax=Salarias fasciatus TaxID=181472 RepID=UPI0011766092|nr:brain natriuretic peptide-like [Salarias fasciatus]